MYVKKSLVELAHSLKDFPEKYSREEYLANEPENAEITLDTSTTTLEEEVDSIIAYLQGNGYIM